MPSRSSTRKLIWPPWKSRIQHSVSKYLRSTIFSGPYALSNNYHARVNRRLENGNSFIDKQFKNQKRMTRKLFSPVNIGPLALCHRVVMAPLTRSRAERPGDVPGSLMREYYSQRASEGGLIISEAT